MELNRLKLEYNLFCVTQQTYRIVEIGSECDFKYEGKMNEEPEDIAYSHMILKDKNGKCICPQCNKGDTYCALTDKKFICNECRAVYTLSDTSSLKFLGKFKGTI